MNITESFRTALDSLRANKMRALLTMLGIIIGIAAVIGLMGLGEGFGELIEDEINSVGTNLIFVASDSENGYPTLTEDDLYALAEDGRNTAVAAVGGVVGQQTEVTAGSNDQFAIVNGVTGNYFALTNNDVLERGGLFDEIDDASFAQVAVLGSDIAYELFDGMNPIGQSITVNNTRFDVVGVLVPGDGGASGDTDSNVYIPMNVALQRLDLQETRFGEPAMAQIVAQAADETQVDAALEQISLTLREQHDLVYGAEDDFSLISQSGLVESFSTISDTMTVFLGAIAAISLVVGGIGIMNIMLVSVTERTREIGIRKAIGAQRRDILAQFLLESLILTLIGGVIGLALGVVVSIVGGGYLSLTPVISTGTVALAVGFSASVGIIFGIYPAWKASLMRPIDALRYE